MWIWLAVVVFVGLGLSFALPAGTPPVRGGDGAPVAGSVATLEPVEVNGTPQWLLIRGRDETNPVLLFVHGGPGTPESVWLAHYNQALEDDFVVVSWEQRGAGKSYPAGCADPAAMTGEQLLADLHAVTAHLKQRFGQERIYLVGHSWGTLLAIRAAHRWPADYHALVSVAQTAHTAREEEAIHDWVVAQARRDGNHRALRRLERLGPAASGQLTLEDLSVRLRWVNHYGGGVMHRPGAMRELVGVLLRRPEYTTWEKLRYLRAEAFSLAHLYHELAGVDLFTEIPALEIPVVLVHGRHDHQVPMAVARDYFDALDAPDKTFVIFDQAAHSPLFEDPARFHRVLGDLLLSTSIKTSLR